MSNDIEDDFEAEFAKVDAIGLIGNATEGTSLVITVQGRMVDGTTISLTDVVRVRN